MSRVGLVFIISLTVLSPAVSATPKFLAAPFKLVGRTANNMVTFHNKSLALAQWASLGALFADAYTTERTAANCQTCFERNPLLGRHPSPLRLALTNTFWVVEETAGEQLLSEHERKLPLHLALAGYFIQDHVRLAEGNSHLLQVVRHD